MITQTVQKNHNINIKTLSCIAISCLVLSGCGNRVALSEQEMANIRNLPSQPIEPPPQPYKVGEFIYSAEETRSPFVAPSLLAAAGKKDITQGIMPDNTREKDPLEEFNLESIVFHGMVISPNGEQFGLVKRPDGTVASVQVGDYIGKNHGRIVEITPTQMNLIELVPSNRSGYVEQAQSLEAPIS